MHTRHITITKVCCPGIIFRTAATLLLLLCATIKAGAQSDAQFSQYYEIQNYYNASAIGTTDLLKIRGGARLQWVGIKNAPQTFLVAADMPFKFLGKRFGTGLVMQQESMGLFSNLTLGAQIAYKLKLFKGTLSIGAQIGFIDQSFKGSEVYIPDGDDYHQPTDPSIPTQDLTGSSVDFSAGVYYSRRNWYAGVSCLHIAEPTVTMSVEGTESTESQEYQTSLQRMVYFTGGGNIPLKNTLFELQPSMMLKTNFSMFQAEATMRATYNKFLSFGLGYRWKDAISVMVGAEFKNFFLGYAYDYPVSAIAKASSGSHEIVAGYRLKLDFSGKNKNKHRSIRIM